MQGTWCCIWHHLKLNTQLHFAAACYAVTKFYFYLQESTSFPLTSIRPIQFHRPQSISFLVLRSAAATVPHIWQHNFWTALRIYVLRTLVPSAWRLTKVTKVRSLPTTTNGDKEISSSTFTPHKNSHPTATLQLPVSVSTYGSESFRSPTVAVQWATLVFLFGSLQVQISACKPANLKLFCGLTQPHYANARQDCYLAY